MARSFRVLSRRELLQGLAAASTAAAAGACRSGGDPENLSVTIDPITPNDEHYVTTCCGNQTVDGSSWTLSIRDEDGELATIDLASLQAMEARDREHTLECIGATPDNQRISNAIWSGLPLTEILAALGVAVPADAVALKIESVEGYSTGLPIDDLDKPIWLVWRMNGDDLPSEHGYPARFLVPGRYGMKNPKWVSAVTFVRQPYVGYWEQQGWSDAAVYRPNALVRYPEESATPVEGPLRVVGTAYAGSDPVVKLEVSLDGGDWQEATLDYQNGADVWVLWHFDWQATAGDHTLQARCTTASGATSDANPWPPFDGGGYGGSMQVDVAVP